MLESHRRAVTVVFCDLRSFMAFAANFALAVAAFLLLFMWQTRPWLVVILSAAAGALIALLWGDRIDALLRMDAICDERPVRILISHMAEARADCSNISNKMSLLWEWRTP